MYIRNRLTLNILFKKKLNNHIKFLKKCYNVHMPIMALPDWHVNYFVS